MTARQKWIAVTVTDIGTVYAVKPARKGGYVDFTVDRRRAWQFSSKANAERYGKPEKARGVKP